MNREHLLLAGLASFVAVGSMLLASPPVEASPLTCEHRSAKHLDEHGGRAADDAYHIARGELPNCDDPSERAGSDHNANSEADGSGRVTAPSNDSDNNRDDDGGFNWPGRRDKLGPFR